MYTVPDAESGNPYCDFLIENPGGDVCHECGDGKDPSCYVCRIHGERVPTYNERNDYEILFTPSLFSEAIHYTFNYLRKCAKRGPVKTDKQVSRVNGQGDVEPSDGEHSVVTDGTAPNESETPVGVPIDNEPPSPPKPTPRLKVDTQTNCAVLDGTEHKLSTEQALFVNYLVEADGLWCSSTEMDITKTDRLKRNLPESIRKMIESQTGKGSRIPREVLWDS